MLQSVAFFVMFSVVVEQSMHGDIAVHCAVRQLTISALANDLVVQWIFLCYSVRPTMSSWRDIDWRNFLLSAGYGFAVGNFVVVLCKCVDCMCWHCVIKLTVYSIVNSVRVFTPWVYLYAIVITLAECCAYGQRAAVCCEPRRHPLTQVTALCPLLLCFTY